MGDKTGIEWTDATWNPTTGCDRTSPGCDNCYTLTMAKRLKLMGSARYQTDGDPRTSGPGFRLAMHDDALDQPLRWKRPRRIFVNSMSDLFHQDVTDEFIADVFAVMIVAKHHTFQVLTKRSQRMAALLGAPDGRWLDLLDDAMLRRNGCMLHEILNASEYPPANVWLGVSVESDRYTFRANHLSDTPAAVRFISAEPLLGPLPSLDLDGIDWVIVGGESGRDGEHRAVQPMHPRWVRGLRDRVARVPFLFKQWGSWCPPSIAGVQITPTHHLLDDGRLYPHDRRLGPDHLCRPALVASAPKKVTGRSLDGVFHDGYPTL